MKHYIGTKQVEAEPMSKGEAYEKGLLKAGIVPSEEERSIMGYHVRYKDGYESWSPKDVFEEAYQISETPLDRMIIEQGELEDRITKLDVFTGSDRFKELDDTVQVLLVAQLQLMKDYNDVLCARMSAMASGKAHYYDRGGFSFGVALSLLEEGLCLRRAGWATEYLPPVVEGYPKYIPLERVEYNKEVNLTYILLNEGSIAVTDGAFYERVSKHTWMKDSNGYASAMIGGRPVRLQNTLFDEVPDGLIVDHINGDKLDNRMCNLRFATNRENRANSSAKKDSTSLYKGVSFDSSRGKWISSIQVNGKTKHLGRYDKEEDAAKAYDRAALYQYGSYARLNFPQYIRPKKFVVKQVPAHITSDIIPKMQSLPQAVKDRILGGKGFVDYTSQCLIYNENTGRADSWVPSISDIFANDWEVAE